MFFNPGLAAYFLHLLKKCIYLCIHIFLFYPIVSALCFLLGGVSKLKMYKELNKQNNSFFNLHHFYINGYISLLITVFIFFIKG